jgi:cytochrome c-type biogenesis protein CcmH
MTLWFLLSVMTAVAAFFVSRPFMRRLANAQPESFGDIAVYQDQLKEVDREASQGLIDAAQAESASAEIKRRLLAADSASEPQLPGLSNGERTVAAIGVTAIVVFGSVGLYALTANLEPAAESAPPLAEASNPAAPEPAAAAPFAGGGAAAPAPMRADAPMTASASKRVSNSAVPPVEEMVQRLVTRLQKNPKDVEGWKTLGWSYFSTEHFTESAAAYARAIQLEPKIAGFHSARAEALAKAANGVVTPEAKSEIEEAVKLDPKDVRARFYIGLAKQQGGDKEAALKDWNDLLATSDANEIFTTDLKQRIAELTKAADEAGAAPSAAATTPKPAAAEAWKAPEAAASVAAPPVAERGPGPEDIRRAEAMKPQDRATMIRTMVDGLASRLEQSPHDADGWIKLIRSRSVLGETEKAKQSLERALKIFADEAPERARIAETAQQLGLSP